MERSKIALIIPAYNEASTISGVVLKTKEFGRVIVVDDASSDRTGELARQSGADVVTHAANRGYDAALQSGFVRAAELECAVAVTLDADGQHDPLLIGQFVDELSKVSLVLGVRARTQRLAEKIFALGTRLRYGVRDPLCGMKGYRMELFFQLGHFDSYGSVGTELALYSLHKRASFSQLPIPIRERKDKPRFDSCVRANVRIFRSMVRGMLLAYH